MKSLILAAAAVLGACVSAAPQAEPVFYVMRHLHKSAEPQDPGLTDQGRACAARLAEALADVRIGAIFASGTRRAQETAAPLAQRIGVAVTSYDPRNTPALVEQVRATAGSVLVVGHSNTVPDIVAGLGGARPEPIDESRYAELWQVARSGGATRMAPIAGC